MKILAKSINITALVLPFWLLCGIAYAQSGPARVVSVDSPEMCLRVRSGPGTSYSVVGCAAMGERVGLTGVWSNTDWAEIDQPLSGWVAGSQIRMIVATNAPAPVEYEIAAPIVNEYYYSPSYVYGPYWYGYRRWRGPYYHRWNKPYYRGFSYRSRGVAVRVGPAGGVAVRAGGVGVRVGPGGVGVRVGSGGGGGRRR
ncbi:MAG TPA: SH3 domain-containing protein [Desulfomonilaceae bacterium]|nr:SH3 domain-containing protein [Desulfomonilaceae bacterium]